MKETFSSEVGGRLREERDNAGLSQAELAVVAGVTREQIGRYERGTGTPGGEVLAALAAAHIDVMYVLTGNRRSQGQYEPPRDYVLLGQCVDAADQAIAKAGMHLTGEQRGRLYLGIYGICLAHGQFNPALIAPMLGLLPS